MYSPSLRQAAKNSINSISRPLMAASVLLGAIITLPITSSVMANEANESQQFSVKMHSVDKNGVGKTIGYVLIQEVDKGLEFQPALVGLKQGLHGFHVHENPSCDTAKKDGVVTPAGAAGSHFDPAKHSSHKAPWDEGHLGDLPALYTDADTTTKHAVYKDNLTLNDLRGRALVIHESGDNYSDEPKPLGGGGGRVACGVFPE